MALHRFQEGGSVTVCYLQSLYFFEKFQPQGQNEVDSAKPAIVRKGERHHREHVQMIAGLPAEVFLCLQLFLPVTEPEEVAFVDVQSHDLLKQLVEGLVGVGHQESSLQIESESQHIQYFTLRSFHNPHPIVLLLPDTHYLMVHLKMQAKRERERECVCGCVHTCSGKLW